jgi:hypothetical protein
MDFFHRPIKTKAKKDKITTFRNLVLILSSGKKKKGGQGDIPNQTLEFDISSIKGTQQIRFITPSLFFLPEDEIRTPFRNVVILSFLAFVLSDVGKSP